MGDGTGYGDEMSFTTDYHAAGGDHERCQRCRDNSATLNGNLSNLGTATSVAVSFEWGLDTGYGNTATASASPMTGDGAFSAAISGLTPGTTYHYRAKAVGDGTDYGDDVSFTTTTTPPAVTTNAATGVGTTSATLNGNLDNLGTADQCCGFLRMGPDHQLREHGDRRSDRLWTGTGAFSAAISGLTPGTTYHYRAKAVGDGTDYGDDVSFTTTTTPPAVTTNAATGVATTSATLNGNLTTLGTASSVAVSFEWGDTSYGIISQRDHGPGEDRHGYFHC